MHTHIAFRLLLRYSFFFWQPTKTHTEASVFLILLLFFFLFSLLFTTLMTVLDIRGCLDDSPTFRKRVQAHEESIQNFEQILKTLIKLTRSQVELSAGSTKYTQPNTPRNTNCFTL